MNRKLMSSIVMFAVGLGLGIVSRLLDIYAQNLGEVFSQMAIWILFGTLISIYSKTAKKAALNVFPFCVGMLITYYAVAVMTQGVYGTNFIIGWTLFALCSPVLAVLAWNSKEKGIFPGVIRIGIVAVSVLSSILLFDRLRIYDLVIDGMLVYFLFFKKVQRH
ncbi:MULTISPECIES: hypothetical protein [unclassified Ruminococcus]|uniref:hypothetical protein n=1 Tax=unclassified Ruminococcus TaxID=2608920 RepID=UPI00210B02B2|nr:MULTISPECIES: hypothetical protein [unclassified Ruminococcus]MCQ4022367.1 hypothetical protein [Ruminococcus sp. zg-924]MCQ4114695.1 hypothetical protein [Ruminococcus sp. zg-921]